MRAYETVISYSYKVHKQKKLYLEDLFIIGDRKIGNRKGGEWIFFFFCCYSKHKSLGIKLHITHSMYKDSWVQDKHKQNSNKGKAEYR